MTKTSIPPRRRLVCLGAASAALAATLLCAAAGRRAAARDDAEGFTPLVTRDDASEFELVGFGLDTIKIQGGEVALSGRPDGYFATRRPYKNYTLRFEWKYDRPTELKDDAKFNGNSGLLIHIVGPHKIWPKCVEMQLMNHDAGHVFGVGAKFEGEKVAGAQKKAIKAVGEWNATEVVCKDGEIAASINGVLISSGTGELTGGKIAWQSEGAPIRFRKLEMKEMK